MTRNAHLDSPAMGAAAAAMWRWLCQAAGVLAVSTLLVACGFERRRQQAMPTLPRRCPPY
jgi:hypothetical protein